MTQLNGKVAVITGGAKGMGLATARIMGHNEYHVVISDVNEQSLAAAKKELKKEKVAVDTYVCDVTDRAAVKKLVTFASSLGTVTSVVHSAGVSPQMGSAEFIMKINATGTINIAEEFYEVAGEDFALVNVASVAGHILPGFMIPKRIFKLALTDPAKFEEKIIKKTKLAPKPARSGQSYSVSKAFVVWYSAKISAKFGEKGARVLSVSPGSFSTDMGKLEEKGGAGKMVEFAALKRFGKPEEIGELLAFVASSKPGYLTGVDILCDGGVKANLTLSDLASMSREK